MAAEQREDAAEVEPTYTEHISGLELAPGYIPFTDFDDET